MWPPVSHITTIPSRLNHIIVGSGGALSCEVKIEGDTSYHDANLRQRVSYVRAERVIQQHRRSNNEQDGYRRISPSAVRPRSIRFFDSKNKDRRRCRHIEDVLGKQCERE